MSDSDYLDYDDEHMNFVTNLFDSCEEYVHEDPDPDPVWDQFDCAYGEDLGLGFAEEFDSMTFGGNAHGLRVVGIDSDSDTEDWIHENGSDPAVSEDVVVIEDQTAGREESDLVDLNKRELVCSVIERIEEMSFLSGTCSEDEDDIVDEYERNLDWEILLAVNNLDRNMELGNTGDDLSYLDVNDEYIYDSEYDVVLGQIVENSNALKINLPAAKSVVENLQHVVFTNKELEDNEVVCAVCKEDVAVEEEVIQLPCCHHYHGGCILPWLSTRNTCPVCRFELPADNANYEHVKFGEAGLRDLDNLQRDKIC